MNGKPINMAVGKNCLKWCDKCNIPVLDVHICPKCKGRTRTVDVTPPWDITPAFDYDLKWICKTFNNDFGDGCGDELIKNNQVVLLNEISGAYKRCEVIFDGCVAAYIDYNLDGTCSASNTMYSASIISKVCTKRTVTCGKNPGKMVKLGRDLMAPGVVDATPDISVGDRVIIRDTDGILVGLGKANMSAIEMVSSGTGVAVKCRKKTMPIHSEGPRPLWSDVIQANSGHMEELIHTAVKFMKDTMKEVKKEAVISFSGGKDSEAVVLLSEDAKLKLPLMFIDSGLEFDETVQFTHDLAERYGRKLIEKNVPTELFFKNIKILGPPAIGYRWCCKIHKLSPLFTLSKRYFPNGNLSFIGQRKYESQSKAKNGDRWVNTWLPENECASPIHEWNALHVWMYIFMRRAPFNVWYLRGYRRIGCVMCPATNSYALTTAEQASEKAIKWKNAIVDYQRSRGLPEEWITYKLWKWKDVPLNVSAELERTTGKNVTELTKRTITDSMDTLIMSRKDPSGSVTEATITGPIDIYRLSKHAKAMNKRPKIEGKGQLTIGNVTVYSKGTIIVNATDAAKVDEKLDELYQVIIRSERCLGCGLCASRCPMGALYMMHFKAMIDPNKCTSCKKCFGPCPSVSFKEADSDESEVTM